MIESANQRILKSLDIGLKFSLKSEKLSRLMRDS